MKSHSYPKTEKKQKEDQSSTTQISITLKTGPGVKFSEKVTVPKGSTVNIGDITVSQVFSGSTNKITAADLIAKYSYYSSSCVEKAKSGPNVSTNKQTLLNDISEENIHSLRKP